MANARQKDRERLRKLHALVGSENEAERETARAKIKEILAKRKLTWNTCPS